MSYFNFHIEISRNVQNIRKNVSSKIIDFEGGYKRVPFDLGWRRQGQVKVILNFLNETS